ncbi:MAG: alpha-L-fucosidase [Phycisphaerae bacterium]
MSRSDWFLRAGYGMFVHWGPYAVAGRGEWVMNRERIPFEEYRRKYAENFRAEQYDPAAWATFAAECGMKYVVLTTRHHDGFALWDTDTTEFNAARLGPGRDLVAPFVEAVRSAGLKVGLYFSVADWTHPDYPAAFARDWPVSEDWESDPARKRFIAYYQTQLEELMTRYGAIDILWYDGCIPGPLDGQVANQRVRDLQPDILINERNGDPFDFRVSEQSLKDKPGPWESALTLNDNWGYHATDENWKGPADVVKMLIAVRSKAGNLLLNVGPRPEGTIPEPSLNILRSAGDWLGRNREFMDTTDRSPFAWNNISLTTVRGNTVYLHLTKDPRGEYCFAELANKVLSARMVDGGAPVAFEQLDDGRLFLKNLPTPLPDPLVTTIALELDGPPKPLTEQKTFWIPE